MDTSVLISSICSTDDTAKNCLLHWGQGAAKIQADGSYTLNNIPPGQYEIVLMIIDSKWATIIELKNVDPVQAGQVTRHDFVTK